MIKEQVGKKIKELRLAKGLSQEELASQCGLDRTYITYVENAKKNVTVETLFKLTTALGVSLADFFSFKEEGFPSSHNEELVMDLCDLVVNNYYTNKQLMAIFKCSSQSGIRVSLKKNTVTLVTKKNGNPYQDEEIEGNKFVFTGTGRNGDQVVKETNQNGKVAFSNTNGFKLFYFQCEGKDKYKFIGQMKLCGDYYFAEEKDASGNMRKVVKFPLTLINSI